MVNWQTINKMSNRPRHFPGTVNRCDKIYNNQNEESVTRLHQQLEQMERRRSREEQTAARRAEARNEMNQSVDRAETTIRRRNEPSRRQNIKTVRIRNNR